MTDKEVQQPTEQQPTEQPAGASNTENTVPYSRFKEINDALKATKAQMDELQKQQQEQREAELAEQQRWQELAEQRKQELEQARAKAERVEALEQAMRNTVATRIEQLPENMRSLVPEFEDPQKTLTWLDANAALLSRPVAPNLDAGAAGNVRTEALPKLTQEQMRIAKVAGMTPEQYAKRLIEGATGQPSNDLNDVMAKLEETGHLR